MQREIFSQITEPRVHHLYVIPDNFLSSLILKEKKKKRTENYHAIFNGTFNERTELIIINRR